MSKASRKRSVFRIQSVDRRVSTRKKAEWAWFAPGFTPEQSVSNNNFAKAAKQTAPKFEVGRLLRETSFDEPDAMVSTVVETFFGGDNRGRSARRERTKGELMRRWREILDGKTVEFRVIGAEIWAQKAQIWIFHPGERMLFYLFFSTENDDWVENPVFYFPDSRLKRGRARLALA